MFDQRAVGGSFAPESVGKPAGRTKHLYRHVVALAFWRAHFRGVEIVRITGIIEDQTVGFARCQAQATADNLLVQADGFGRAKNRNQVNVRGVKPGG